MQQNSNNKNKKKNVVTNQKIHNLLVYSEAFHMITIECVFDFIVRHEYAHKISIVHLCFTLC